MQNLKLVSLLFLALFFILTSAAFAQASLLKHHHHHHTAAFAIKEGAALFAFKQMS